MDHCIPGITGRNKPPSLSISIDNKAKHSCSVNPAIHWIDSNPSSSQDPWFHLTSILCSDTLSIHKGKLINSMYLVYIVGRRLLKLLLNLQMLRLVGLFGLLCTCREPTCVHEWCIFIDSPQKGGEAILYSMSTNNKELYTMEPCSVVYK